jgi:hypothetical protein
VCKSIYVSVSVSMGRKKEKKVNYLSIYVSALVIEYAKSVRMF